jgi:hypothetical protein
MKIISMTCILQHVVVYWVTAEILRCCAHTPYVIDSPLWAQWFEAEHDARRAMSEAHLEGLDNDDFDYDEAEAAFHPSSLPSPPWQPPRPRQTPLPPKPVKKE